MEQHLNKLIVVLHQKAKNEQSNKMKKTYSLQKSAHHVKHVGEIGIAKCLVYVFAFFRKFVDCFIHYEM
jgi:hypothetical protein